MDFSYRAGDPRINAALRDLKRELAALLASHIEDRPLGDATVILDMSPGLAGDLRRGRVDRASLDRLMRTALRLGYQVRLDIRPPGGISARRESRAHSATVTSERSDAGAMSATATSARAMPASGGEARPA